jgi:hypothetical protein
MAGPLIIALTFLTVGGLKMYEGLKPHYRDWIQRFKGNSHFGQLQVMDRTNYPASYYLNDFLIQNTYDLESKQSMSHFYLHAGRPCQGVHHQYQRCPLYRLRRWHRADGFRPPGRPRRVVEINPAVVPVAQHFFGLEPTSCT